MELEEARELLRKCQRDRAHATAQIQEAQATLDSARLIIQGIVARYPQLREEEKEFNDAWESDESERPTGSEAVLSILQVYEGQEFTVSDMVEELRSHDWLPKSGNPPNAVRTALERLVNTAGTHVIKGRNQSGSVIYTCDEEEEQRQLRARASWGGADEEPF